MKSIVLALALAVSVVGALFAQGVPQQVIGVAVGAITGMGTGVATFLTTPTSANLAAAVTDETGSGSLVFATSPTLRTSATITSAVAGNPSLTVSSTNSGSQASVRVFDTTASSVGGQLASGFGSNAAITALDNAGNFSAIVMSWDSGGHPFFNNIQSDAGQTDSTGCVVSSTKELRTGTGAAGICLGTSSARFKRNIRPDDADFRKVLLLRPMAYEPIEGPERTHHFFVAEDVQRVFPDLVGTDADGRANNIDYLGLLTKTIALVQEQQRQIAVLESQVKRLAR